MILRKLLAGLTLVACVGGACAQIPPLPARPVMGQHPPGMAVRLSDQEALFRWIMVERRLGDPWDAQLLARLQADSRMARFREPGTQSSVMVVQVELRNPDGSSRARSRDGNYPFYVLREQGRELTLLGRMFGHRYQSQVQGSHLEFVVELHPSPTQRVPMHFRVEGETLTNLSAPPPRFQDVLARG